MGASCGEDDGNTGGAPLLKWEDNTIGNSRIIGGEEEEEDNLAQKNKGGMELIVDVTPLPTKSVGRLAE